MRHSLRPRPVLLLASTDAALAQRVLRAPATRARVREFLAEQRARAAEEADPKVKLNPFQARARRQRAQLLESLEAVLPGTGGGPAPPLALSFKQACTLGLRTPMTHAICAELDGFIQQHGCVTFEDYPSLKKQRKPRKSFACNRSKPHESGGNG